MLICHTLALCVVWVIIGLSAPPISVAKNYSWSKQLAREPTRYTHLMSSWTLNKPLIKVQSSARYRPLTNAHSCLQCSSGLKCPCTCTIVHLQCSVLQFALLIQESWSHCMQFYPFLSQLCPFLTEELCQRRCHSVQRRKHNVYYTLPFTQCLSRIHNVYYAYTYACVCVSQCCHSVYNTAEYSAITVHRNTEKYSV